MHFVTYGYVWLSGHAGDFSNGVDVRLCHTMPHYAILCRTMPHYATLCRTMPHYAGLCHTMPDYVKLCHTMPHYATLCRTMPDYATLCHTMPDYAGLCHTMPDYATLCRTMPHYAGLCRTMPHYAGLCHTMPDYAIVCQVCHHVENDLGFEISLCWNSPVIGDSTFFIDVPKLASIQILSLKLEKIKKKNSSCFWNFFTVNASTHNVTLPEHTATPVFATFSHQKIDIFLHVFGHLCFWMSISGMIADYTEIHRTPIEWDIALIALHLYSLNNFRNQ